jgi:heme/copper-type cytochrome/quinol oxidase subunit 4
VAPTTTAVATLNPTPSSGRQEPAMEISETRKGPSVMKLGLLAFVILAVFTGVEYLIAIEMEDNIIPLVLIAQVKAVLILWFFMHIKRAFVPEEH